MGTVAVRVFFLLTIGGLSLLLPGCSSGDQDAMTVDVSQLPPEQQVIEASAAGNVDALKDLLAANPELANVRGENGRTPMHFAAANGQKGAVQFLLEHGGDPFAEDEDGVRPQAVAQQWQHIDIAKLIGAAIAQAGGAPAGEATGEAAQ